MYAQSTGDEVTRLCVPGDSGLRSVLAPMLRFWFRFWLKLYPAMLLPLMLCGCGGNVINYGSLPSSATGGTTTATQHGAIQLAPQYVALGAGQSTQFVATVTGTPQVLWLVNGVAGGSAAVGTISAQGLYTAPTSLVQSGSTVITAELAASPQSNYATSVALLVAPGVVSPTNNPQVASYAIALPAPGTTTIHFGQTAGYGLSTSAQSSPASGGTVSTLVAGMLGSTLYHMTASIVFADGATFVDADHSFTTGTPPHTAPVAVTTTLGGAPQPGVELFDTLRPPETAQAFATDLNGNVIWTYNYNGSPNDLVQPIKLLPDGNFLVQIAYASSLPVQPGGSVPAGALDEVREVDLAGNTVRSVTSAQIASSLLAQGYSLQLGSLHHDVLALPNGHMVLLFSVKKSFTNLPGYPGTTNVLGDLLVDVDQNYKPDWVWNSFDHLDINRHPYLFPDWTHSNALLYSSDDHNLLLSVRHQNWILKIDFEDGTGTGNIVWRLGEGGDFQLQGGTDPTDWFYAQHGPSFFSVNNTGIFQLGVMDNGDDRTLPSGQVSCPVGGPPSPDCYSTAEVYQINESQKTATVLDRYQMMVGATPVYSFFGGNVDLLANTDMQADFCAAPGGSVVQELAGPFGSQNLVWQAITPSANQYRAVRLPSLYPGVQW